MSLLLDALKKAEEAKRQAVTNGQTPPETPATTPELSLEVLDGGAPKGMSPSSPLPELSDHIDAVDADLAAVGAAAPMRGATMKNGGRAASQASPPSGQAANQEAVRNVFAAKRTPAPNRTPLWIGLGIVGLAAVGVGTWFWWKIQSVGNGTLAARPVATATIAPPLPAPAPTPQAASQPTPLQPSILARSPLSTEAEAARRAPERPVPESPVRISRGELKIPPALSRAYEQLQAEDLAGAAHSYEQVLKGDSRNTDALLGMAAIAVRQGNLGAAEGWYVKALEADPKDVNAQAGLINLRGQSDPSAAESRLKNLLAAQPESPTLNFALGNLYAGQRRWPEAQLAYFNAHTADPNNPDYLYNLATSLDHMHLPKIAIDYYKAALAAGTGRRPGFNPDQIKARIVELQP